jgi:adenylate cyclase
MGQWRYSLSSDKLTTTMQIAKRVCSLAQEQNDSALLIGAYRGLAATHYFLGDFETARQYAMRGVQLWRSGSVQCQIEEIIAPAVACLCYEALSEWHLAKSASCHAILTEAISLAKHLNDMQASVLALYWAGWVAYLEDNPAEVRRLASGLIELSTHQNFALWLPVGVGLTGWAQSASGHTAEGISWIENGIEAYRATGSMLTMPFLLILKAEALHFADRASEALLAISEAEPLVELSEGRCWCAELYRLRGVFLAAMGSDQTQIEASFGAAIRSAKQQKSVSLARRAEASYAEYRRKGGKR